MFLTPRRVLLLLALSSMQTHAQAPQSGLLSPQSLSVIVRDSSNNAVQGLKPENFALTQANQPLTLLSVAEHTPASPPAPADPLTLSPGSFTDVTPVASDATINVLLLDALNTPAKSPVYIRSLLRQFVARSDAAHQVAVIGLANHLILLQGFNSPPRPLQDAVEHKLIPRASSAAVDATAAPSAALLAANLHMFEAQISSVEIRFAPQNTLDALNDLAHYLAAIPGRKNLIWVSAAFPSALTVAAASTAATKLDVAELHETRTLLCNAQVAIYPVDARSFAAAITGKDVPALTQSVGDQRRTMTQLADVTGGEAIFDAPNLHSAINKVVEATANSYTLSYMPSSTNQTEELHLALVGTSGTNIKLSYNHFAVAKPAKPSDAYSVASMARGAPAPADIPFKVRVLPAAAKSEPTVAPDNLGNPTYKLPGPWQRYDVDFAAPPEVFTLKQEAGAYNGKVEFLAYVHDINGRLLNTSGKIVAIHVPVDGYRNFLSHTSAFHLEVSVPLRQETYLRIGIHDVPSNRFGVVELPASSVSQLPPPVYKVPPTTAAPSKPATSPAASPR